MQNVAPRATLNDGLKTYPTPHTDPLRGYPGSSPNAVDAAIASQYGDPDWPTSDPTPWWPDSTSQEKDHSIQALDAVLAEYDVW